MKHTNFRPFTLSIIGKKMMIIKLSFPKSTART